MNKILGFIITIMGFITLTLNVNAEAANAPTTDDPDYNTLLTNFEKGIQTTNISTSEWVTLYGKSMCNGSTCTLEYAGQYSKFEDVLKRSVACTNGETNITYQIGSSGKTQYAESNEAKFTGTVYWSEDYYVTCTSTSTGNSTITLENTGNNNTTNDNSGSTNTDSDASNNSSGSTNTGTNNNGSNNTNNNSGGTNNEYDSSTTVEPSETGVTTYFIVLAFVAIISYVAMIFIKKFNLFKNV